MATGRKPASLDVEFHLVWNLRVLVRDENELMTARCLQVGSAGEGAMLTLRLYLITLECRASGVAGLAETLAWLLLAPEACPHRFQVVELLYLSRVTHGAFVVLHVSDGPFLSDSEALAGCLQ